MAKYYFVTRKGSVNENNKQFKEFSDLKRNKYIFRINENSKQNNNKEKISTAHSKMYSTPQECFKFNSIREEETAQKLSIGFFNRNINQKAYEDGILYIEIVDTGEGIKIEEQSKLFQPFSQASSSQQSKGTGLGLWLCSKLLELMKGKIKLYSEINKGTVIKIAIPLVLSKSQQCVLDKASENIIDSTPIHAFPSLNRHSSKYKERKGTFNIYIICEDPNFQQIFLTIKAYVNNQSKGSTIDLISFKEMKHLNYDLKFPTIFLFSLNKEIQFNYLNFEIQRIRKIEMKQGFSKNSKPSQIIIFLSILI